MAVTINGTNGVTFNDATTQSTALSTTSVLNATAGATFGAVGFYGYFFTTTAVAIGNNVAGSSLLKKINGCGTSASAGLSGTWKNLGPWDNVANAQGMFLRVS